MKCKRINIFDSENWNICYCLKLRITISLINKWIGSVNNSICIDDDQREWLLKQSQLTIITWITFLRSNYK